MDPAVTTIRPARGEDLEHLIELGRSSWLSAFAETVSAALIILVAFAMIGCAGARGTVHSQIARKWDCSDIRLHEVRPNVFDAAGCGRFGRFTCLVDRAEMPDDAFSGLDEDLYRSCVEHPPDWDPLYERLEEIDAT